MKKNTLTKAGLVAALVLTPAVIGRYGEPLAEFLRPEVLLGFGVVATLVALITTEYRRRTPPRAFITRTAPSVPVATAKVVAFPARAEDERAAA